MSIDYYSCNYCGDTFNDCGYYVTCDCGNSWCSDECAKKDGYRKTKGTCKFCRGEDVRDEELIKFALKQLGLTRKELVLKYNAK